MFKLYEGMDPNAPGRGGILDITEIGPWTAECEIRDEVGGEVDSEGRGVWSVYNPPQY